MLSFGSLHADVRGSFPTEERHVECVHCGLDLVVLPNDHRHCLCFDCTRLSTDD
jgi:hypothetical protein